MRNSSPSPPLATAPYCIEQGYDVCTCGRSPVLIISMKSLSNFSFNALLLSGEQSPSIYIFDSQLSSNGDLCSCTFFSLVWMLLWTFSQFSRHVSVEFHMLNLMGRIFMIYTCSRMNKWFQTIFKWFCFCCLLFGGFRFRPCSLFFLTG